MKQRQKLPLIAVIVTVLACLATARANSVSAATTGSDRPYQSAPLTPGMILAQSPNDEGACYTWNRVNPFQEMCNHTTRSYCEAANSVFVGSRFVEGGVCPDAS